MSPGVSQGEVHSDRVEDQGIGSSFGARPTHISVGRRGPFPAARPCITRGSRMRRLRRRQSLFPRDLGRGPLGLPFCPLEASGSHSRGWFEGAERDPTLEVSSETSSPSRGASSKPRTDGEVVEAISAGRARTRRTRSGHSSSPFVQSAEAPRRFELESPEPSSSVVGWNPPPRTRCSCGTSEPSPVLASATSFGVRRGDRVVAALHRFRCFLRACERVLFTVSAER